MSTQPVNRKSNFDVFGKKSQKISRKIFHRKNQFREFGYKSIDWFSIWGQNWHLIG